MTPTCRGMKGGELERESYIKRATLRGAVHFMKGHSQHVGDARGINTPNSSSYLPPVS